MSIIVVCTGCRKSFKVSDKFAGKSGPCPNCKRVLQVPTKAEEVKIHVPQEFATGGRDASGKPVLKPIPYRSAKFRPLIAAIIAVAALAVVAIAWYGGRAGVFQSTWMTALALVLISPPLAIAAYGFLHDDEFEPYRGIELCVRSSLCGLAYVALWGVFALLSHYEYLSSDLWIWLFFLPPWLVAGGSLAVATLDLDFGDATLHYTFYVLVTVLLHRVAGMEWIWNVAAPTTM